jgi:hypothetical protein
MPVTFVDQLMGYLSNSANVPAFIQAIQLGAFAGESFTRRYGQNGFQVDAVALGTPAGFQLQELVLDDLRLLGTSERRSDCERKLFDFRYRKHETLGWVDASFAAPGAFSLHAIPGSFTLGAGGNVQQAGAGPGTPPMTVRSKFLLSLSTDQFTLSYDLRVYLFASAALSPTDDLRRILTLRKYLEADPNFLVSLDGPPGQQPFLFVQAYASDAANGAALTQPQIVQMFDADDILATFFAIPA